MPAVIPLAAFGLVFYLCRSRGFNWREAFLTAATVWGVYVVVLTESLSSVHAVTRAGVTVAWLVFCLATLVLLLRIRRSRRFIVPPVPAEDSAASGKAGAMLLASVGVIVLLIGLTAWCCPPNAWDAMEYHLPRVVHWIENRGVQFYPSRDYGQLIFSPWAEYATLQFDILWRGDRLVNFVEWFSLIGCAIGVSCITGLLGGSRWAQLLAAVFSATIAEGVLEASGAMNTYVVAFWMVVSVYFLLRWNIQQTWFHIVGLGLAVGLAALSKGTAYVYLPAILAADWWIGPSRARLQLLARLPIIILLTVLLNGPQFIRNYRMTGSPLGLPIPDGGARLKWKNDRVTLPLTASNLIRNASLNLGTPSVAVNQRFQSVLVRVIRAFGADPDDPANTWAPTTASNGFHLNVLSRHEVTAGNPLQFGLIAIACIVLLARKRPVRPRGLILYLAGILGGYLIFAALLRWQMWGARHQLPLFVLASPAVGIALALYFSRRAAVAVSAALVGWAGVLALTNSLRPIVPSTNGWLATPGILTADRSQLYFADQHKHLSKSFHAAASSVLASGCRVVGLDAAHGDDEFYVYPMLALLDAGQLTQVVDMDVHNFSAQYQRAEVPSSPCAVVCLGCAHARQKLDEYRTLGPPSAFEDVAVFWRAP